MNESIERILDRVEETLLAWGRGDYIAETVTVTNASEAPGPTSYDEIHNA